MHLNLTGVGVALVTPFLPNKTIDFDGLTNVINHVIDGGVDYVVSLGTTGEVATLTTQEKHQVFDHTLTVVNKRVPVIAGFGGNNTQAILEDMSAYDCSQFDAILSVSPYYNKPTQEGIYQHYATIAKYAPVPVIVYNVPGRTSSNISAKTTLRLAQDCTNIIATKEASGDLAQCMDIIHNKQREDFALISGDDILTLPLLALGGQGVISVVANAFPHSFSTMVKAALEGDFVTARHFHYQLLTLFDLLFVEGNPAGVKATLKILGVCGDTLRLPLVNVSSATYQKLEQGMATSIAVRNT